AHHEQSHDHGQRAVQQARLDDVLLVAGRDGLLESLQVLGVAPDLQVIAPRGLGAHASTSGSDGSRSGRTGWLSRRPTKYQSQIPPMPITTTKSSQCGTALVSNEGTTSQYRSTKRIAITHSATNASF